MFVWMFGQMQIREFLQFKVVQNDKQLRYVFLETGKYQIKWAYSFFVCSKISIHLLFFYFCFFKSSK